MANREYLIAPWIRIWHWSNALLILTLAVTGNSLHFADPNLVDNPATPPPARENRRPVTRGRTFNDFLPAVNLILDLSDRDILRMSYSRQISRPRFFELRGSISVNTGSDGNTSGGGGAKGW